MIDPPEQLQHACPQWLWDYLEDLRAYMVAITPLEGPGISISEQPQGLLLDAYGKANLGAEIIPFHCLRQGDQLRVIRGTANGVQPAGMFLGDSPPLLMAITASRRILLKLTVSQNTATNVWSIDSAAIVLDATLPAATATECYIELGSIGDEQQITSNRLGTIFWERNGNATDYLDAAFGVGG
jgi:hypothetical protein